MSMPSERPFTPISLRQAREKLEERQAKTMRKFSVPRWRSSAPQTLNAGGLGGWGAAGGRTANCGLHSAQLQGWVECSVVSRAPCLGGHDVEGRWPADLHGFTHADVCLATSSFRLPGGGCEAVRFSVLLKFDMCLSALLQAIPGGGCE